MPQLVRAGFLPVGKALADLSDSVRSGILRHQNSTAQDARIEEEREALLGRQCLGRSEPPPGALRLAPKLVSHRCKDQGQQQTEWVPELLGQMQRIVDACLRLFR